MPDVAKPKFKSCSNKKQRKVNNALMLENYTLYVICMLPQVRVAWSIGHICHKVQVPHDSVLLLFEAICDEQKYLRHSFYVLCPTLLAMAGKK